MRVTHSGGNTEGNVLRADAIMLVPFITGIDRTTSSPETYSLEQNYPNPFNPSTTIRFTVPTSTFVMLKVYDLLGREISTLVEETLPQGAYSRVFSAERIASGVYLYRLQAGSFSTVKKMMVLR